MSGWRFLIRYLFHLLQGEHIERLFDILGRHRIASCSLNIIRRFIIIYGIRERNVMAFFLHITFLH
jgi:hypothetical protein